MKVNELIEKYRQSINKLYSHQELEEIIKSNPELEYALINIIPLLNIQPEDSKREDCNCPDRYLLNGNYSGKYCRCGALKSTDNELRL